MAEQESKIQNARGLIRALRHRNYRIYFFCMFVSFIGTWMQNVAQSWLVYRLTGSEFLLGVIGFAGQAPVMFFGLLGGVAADRYNRHRIVLLTQMLAMGQALLLAWLTLSGQVTFGWVLSLSVSLGMINALDLPTRQSFLSELVAREDLMNAIALNSTMINGARIVGPAVAGLLVAWLGEGVCFLLNGLSFIAVVGGLLSLRLPPGQKTERHSSALANLREGFDFVRKTRPIRALLLLIALVGFFGLSYIVLMPIFADRILVGGPRSLGFLMSGSGGGAVLGALTLAARRETRGLGRVVAASIGMLGGALICFALSRYLLLSVAALVPVGYGLMLCMSASNTLLQTMVPDRLRGRVMSFYSTSLIGTVPFGNLFVGAAAVHIGAPLAVALGGLICLVGALWFRRQLPGLREEAVAALHRQQDTNHDAAV